MPKMFPNTSTPMLAGSAIVQMDYVHFWNFNWMANTTWRPYTSGMYTSGTHLADRELRHKLSINTCQGCHTGETKTIFTHVRPLGYGEEADYTGTTPGYHSDQLHTLRLDTRFVHNFGQTNVKHGSVFQLDPNYDRTAAHASVFFPKVSAFITGRNYGGPLNSPSFDDDDPNDARDDTLGRDFFVVNDPANMASTNRNGLPPKPNSDNNLQHGFNELDRRLQDMCVLLNTGCVTASSSALEIIGRLTKVPFVE